MKKIYILGLIIALIMVFCSGCILPDGEPLTTERITELVYKRCGEGRAKIRQVDKKTWQISPTDYPDIKYTIKQKIGHGGVIPVPAYTYTEDRMKQVGRIVVPKFFSSKERKKLQFSDGIIKISYNAKSDADVETMCTKLEAMCEYMNNNYGAVVRDEYVMMYFDEMPIRVSTDRKYKKTVMRDNLSRTKITSYLDSKYGSGTYTFRKVPSDEVSHEGEVEVTLNEYPDMPFYLAANTNASKRGKLTDTLYSDMLANLVFNFPKDDYDSSSYLEISAQDNLDGELYNGVRLKRYLKWGDESGVISNMQAIRKALRVYLNQYPMINYSDYPKNQHKVKPPICMEISVQF